MLGTQRHLFDVPDHVAYFNAAFNSPQLLETQRCIEEGARAKCRPWQRSFDSFFSAADDLRTSCARLFGGRPDDFAVVPATSYGMSTAARAVEPTLGAGSGVLLQQSEFPSTALPWMRVAGEKGATIHWAPTPKDGDWTEAILSRLSRNVGVVVVSSCHWTNGARVDLERVGEACRSAGAILAVDATQSLGVAPLSLGAIRPDFLVASGYKWLLCPYGVGVLYVSERWHDARPLEESWLTRDSSVNPAQMAVNPPAYMPGARRFDVGETCTEGALSGALSALAQIERWGIGAISGYLAALSSTVTATIEGWGFSLPDASHRSAHIFGGKLPPGYSGDLVAALAAHDIYVSQRGDAIRFAPHVHVNENDVDRLLAVLKRVLER